MIADGKRGDFAGTARAYGQALLRRRPRRRSAPSPGLGADAVTPNPLLGEDALEPLIDGARAARRRRLRARPHVESRRRRPLRRRARRRRPAVGADRAAGRRGRHARARVGARRRRRRHRRDGAPSTSRGMRELMPRTPFLLPGIGAQGGDVAALAPAFAPGRAGGLVSASRSIADAHEAAGGDARRRGPRRGRAAARAGVGAGLTAGPSGAGLSSCRWPDAAPRASSRRSRWWPSRVALFLVVSTALKDDRRHVGQRLADARRSRRRQGRRRRRASRRSGAQDLHGQDRATRPPASPRRPTCRSTTILQLNPDLDPQVLTPGTKIKLR